MTLNENSVLVTGATGLVGSHLVNKLIQSGKKVSVFEYDFKFNGLNNYNLNPEVNIFRGNLQNFSEINHAVLQSEAKLFFHLGAQTLVGIANRSPYDTFETNIKGTWNLLESIRLNVPDVKAIVVASSDKAYGMSLSLPYTEETPLLGNSPYEVSKSCTDLIAQTYAQTYRMPIAIARCGNIYGGGDLNWSRLIPGTIKSLLSNLVPEIRSDGKMVRDYIYVEDVVAAYLILAKKLINEECNATAFNFSTDVPNDVLEVYTLICNQITGKYVEPIITNKASNEIQEQHLDSSKARIQLGWNAKFDLYSGLSKTIEWYKTYLQGNNVN